MNKLTINEYGSVIDSSGKTFLLNGVAIPCGNADKQSALNTKDMVERYNSHDKLTADNAALVEALERIANWNDLDVKTRCDIGSNGERNHYIAVAREALKQAKGDV